MGIIGCGWAGSLHAAAIQKLRAKIHLAAACDRIPQKAEALAGTYGIAAHASDYAGILNRETLDAVSLCLPHHLHAEAAIRAAEAGLHVLVEKPLSATLEEADRMIEAARRYGVLLMVEHVYALEAPKALSTMAADDTSAALVGLASGAVGIIVESFSIKTETRGVRGIIHGTGGSLAFGGTGISLYTAEEDGRPDLAERITVEEGDGFVAEIEDFAESIQSNQTPVSTAEEGRKSLACVIAAYQSMRTGRRAYVTGC